MADGVLPDFTTEVPQEILDAVQGILDDVYSKKVRQDIVDALTWGIEKSLPVGKFVNSLGLCVWDNKLCYTDEDVLPVYDEIPQEVQDVLDRILTDVFGKDLRNDIVIALRWGGSYTSQVSGFIADLGLTVVDGKLCAIFHPEGV